MDIHEFSISDGQVIFLVLYFRARGPRGFHRIETNSVGSLRDGTLAALCFRPYPKGTGESKAPLQPVLVGWSGRKSASLPPVGLTSPKATGRSLGAVGRKAGSRSAEKFRGILKAWRSITFVNNDWFALTNFELKYNWSVLI